MKREVGDRELEAAILSTRTATRRPTSPLVLLVVWMQIAKVIMMMLLTGFLLGLGLSYLPRHETPCSSFLVEEEQVCP
jgi:hypothetical protein